MKIAIDKIRIDEEIRIRKDVGNISSLEQSIKAVGLINPLLIDEEMKLLAGFRRLTACKNLGWKEIEVRIIELQGDQLKMLDVEIAENFYRKDFTPEEILASEERRNKILEERRPKGLFERFWLWLKGLFRNKPPSGQTAAEKKTGDTIGDAALATPLAAKPAVEKKEVQPPSAASTEQTPGSVATAAAANVGTEESATPPAEDPPDKKPEEIDQVKEK